MGVKFVLLDPRNQTPIVVLESEDGAYALPIWIGAYEATSIITALEEIELPRAMTHDLMIDMLESLGAELEYVVIHEMRDGNFVAELALKCGEEKSKVEARPSDSIALALRAHAPILAEKAVCDRSDTIEKFLKEAQAEQYKEYLDSLDPNDISKYKM